jgi:hypothetical protein
LLCFGFHFVFHSDDSHCGFFYSSLDIWLHASASSLIWGVTELLTILIWLIVILWHLAIGLLHCFFNFLFVVVFLDEILNSLLFLSHRLFL